MNNRIVLYKPCSELEKVFIRPENGEVFIGYSSKKGPGVLKVNNPGDTDIFILLVDVNKSTKTYGLFVHSGSRAEAKVISDGTYEVYYTAGKTWVNYQQRFQDATTYAKFDETLTFESDGLQYKIWELTMQATTEGNAPTSEIDPSDFPTP